MFILIFPLQNRGIIVFSHYQTNHSMFAYQKFKFFLMVPKGILKKFVVIVPAYYGLVQGEVKQSQKSSTILLTIHDLAIARGKKRPENC
jgi:hypothetical protein